MGIINRDLDASQKRHLITGSVGALATGVSTVVGMVPNNGLITSCFATAFGLSNTPTVSFSLLRLTSGGLTAIGLGATITVPAFGTSAVLAATILGGVTALQGDLVLSLSGGSNAAVTSEFWGVVLQRTDAYVQFPGSV